MAFSFSMHCAWITDLPHGCQWARHRPPEPIMHVYPLFITPSFSQKRNVLLPPIPIKCRKLHNNSYFISHVIYNGPEGVDLILFQKIKQIVLKCSCIDIKIICVHKIVPRKTDIFCAVCKNTKLNAKISLLT